MQFLKHQHDDNMDWIQNNKRMQTIDRNTADFIQTTTGTDLHLKDKDEVIDMCKAWDNSMKQAEAKGEAKGIKAAIAMAKSLSIGQPQVIEQLMKSFNLSHEQALEAVQANW